MESENHGPVGIDPELYNGEESAEDFATRLFDLAMECDEVAELVDFIEREGLTEDQKKNELLNALDTLMLYRLDKVNEFLELSGLDSEVISASEGRQYYLSHGITRELFYLEKDWKDFCDFPDQNDEWSESEMIVELRNVLGWTNLLQDERDKRTHLILLGHASRRPAFIMLRNGRVSEAEALMREFGVKEGDIKEEAYQAFLSIYNDSLDTALVIAKQFRFNEEPKFRKLCLDLYENTLSSGNYYVEDIQKYRDYFGIPKGGDDL